jgi:hypothetical protein
MSLCLAPHAEPFADENPLCLIHQLGRCLHLRKLLKDYLADRPMATCTERPLDTAAECAGGSSPARAA